MEIIRFKRRKIEKTNWCADEEIYVSKKFWAHFFYILKYKVSMKVGFTCVPRILKINIFGPKIWQTFLRNLQINKTHFYLTRWAGVDIIDSQNNQAFIGRMCSINEQLVQCAKIEINYWVLFEKIEFLIFHAIWPLEFFKIFELPSKHAMNSIYLKKFLEMIYKIKFHAK